MKLPALLALFVAALSITACSGIESEAKYPTRDGGRHAVYDEPESIFGPDGINLLGGSEDEKQKAAGLGVNKYLWRATLDTLSFMPIATADPFGGTILTDWYMPNPDANERVKVNAFILSQELRSDALKITTFRQILKNGTWVDAPTDDKTAFEMENTVLLRARELRIASIKE